jgi:tetratricopeptide (TPR) repeat protein
MAIDATTLKALRDALQVSPDNVPLRQHHADLLLGDGQLQEAEKEYRLGLGVEPDNVPLKSGLAHAFYLQGKYDQALVLIEDVLRAQDVPARLYLLHARLLLHRGEQGEAARQYRRAIEADPQLDDADLAGRLGLSRVPAEEPTPVRAIKERELVQATEPDDAAVERPGGASRSPGAAGGGGPPGGGRPGGPPDLYRAYGKQIGGGILMYGPPGCGKTHLARATPRSRPVRCPEPRRPTSLKRQRRKDVKFPSLALQACVAGRVSLRKALMRAATSSARYHGIQCSAPSMISRREPGMAECSRSA